jgi:beta-fructofuranosidase
MPEYANEAVTRAMASVQGATARVKDDPTRPIYHVMPPALWCNDPNGPIYHKGHYHLFYQHNPFGDRWQHMHWGHARSKDLVHWEHLPIALWPSEERGEDHCFSGCAAVNADGKPVIFYTSIGRNRPPEQWLAVGSDDLLKWEKHPANPVLTEALHGNAKPREWRDPFVFREAGKWYMVCGGHRAGGKGCVFLYRSDDLVKWEYVGVPFEGTEDNWECPNFFKLGGKWVLIYSPHGIVKYYTGTFDLSTHKFTPEYHGTLDHGENFYAPNCCFDARGRCLLWGWVRGFPGGKGWNGCLTLPRVLTLGPTGELLQAPAPELARLRERDEPGAASNFGPLRAGSDSMFQSDFSAEEAELELDAGRAEAVVITLKDADADRPTCTLTWDGQRLTVGSTTVDLSRRDAAKPLRLKLFLDRSVLEAYADGACLTKVVPLTAGKVHQIHLSARGGDARAAARLWHLKSIWRN